MLKLTFGKRAFKLAQASLDRSPKPFKVIEIIELWTLIKS